ncbi:MAG: hypothetical protein J4G13_15960 [Dehalococcoidia bacterium]|nr:hypothetical protein [Dehalococcoidia bacterium]
MARLSTIRTPRIALLLGLALLSFAAVLVGSVAASWWDKDDSTVSGTVDGTDWEGRAYVGWKAPVPPGYIQYGGQGITEADAVIDELYVKTKGSEWCGLVRMDIDWNETHYANDGWVVGGSGNGTALPFICAFWYFNPNVTVRIDVNHRVWDGDESDSGEHKAVVITDLVPPPPTSYD